MFDSVDRPNVFDFAPAPAAPAAPPPIPNDYQVRVVLPDGTVFEGDHRIHTGKFHGVRHMGDSTEQPCAMDAEDVLALEADTVYAARADDTPPPPVPARVNANEVRSALYAAVADSIQRGD